MNDSKKKANTAFAWAAFLASYGLVWLVISMPMERQPEPVARSQAIVATLSMNE